MLAETLYKQEEMSIVEICNHLKISRSTLYKYLRFREVKIGNYTKTDKEAS